jgi:glycerol-3-phosphate dehydrogenase (NAD(P)+)
MAADRGTIAVIGAGSWGTALGIALGRADRQVTLWARRPELAEAIAREGRNPEYLPEFRLPEGLQATADIGQAVAGAQLVVLAVPSQGVRTVCLQLAQSLERRQGLVSAAKGLERHTGQRLSEVVSECVGRTLGDRIAVLSGPNLAPEVAAGDATVSVAASRDAQFAAEVQAAMSTPLFRVYTNPDVLGVELGGVLKNIIAIGAGISDGLGFGDNTKAALVTRGLAEMTRLGVTLGARAATFGGLSGVGDLIVTCAGNKSRNYRVGYELAKGACLDDVLQSMAPQIVEGVETTGAALRLAAGHEVEMPIATAVHQVLFEEVQPAEAVASLMTRAWRDELDG